MYGKQLSDEHKEKIRDSLIGIKRTFSQEAKHNMSEAQKGKVLSEETKRKIGIAGKGRIVSDVTRKKMSDLQNNGKSWNIGKKLSEETKIKISAANKGKKKNMTEEGRRRLSESITKRNKEKSLLKE